MYFDRALFFTALHRNLFPSISQGQTDGLDRWLDLWESRQDLTDIRWLAYVLATNYWETGRRMMPVVEIGKGRGRSYGQLHAPTHSGSAIRVSSNLIYYGRGDPQLTWFDNYAGMQAITGWPLRDQPDAMLDPKISAEVTVEGMTKGKSSRGDFTGKSLENYFNASTDDPTGARRIINGTDHAADIAAIYHHFLDCLRFALKDAPVDDHKPVTLPTLPTPAQHDAAINVKPPTVGSPATVGGAGAGAITGIFASGFNKWAVIAGVIILVAAVVIHLIASKKPVYTRLSVAAAPSTPQKGA